jgi:hypothetical protein
MHILAIFSKLYLTLLSICAKIKMIKQEGGKMMSEHSTLSSYLEALITKKEALDSINIDVAVDERLADMRARVRAEVVAEVNHASIIVDAQIDAIRTAVAIVARPVEGLEQVAEESEYEVSEVITDETY